MGRYHTPAQPAGATGRPMPVLEQFQTDVVNKVLWIADTAGLGVLGAACALMDVRCNGAYEIKRVSAADLTQARKSGRYRARLLAA